MNVSETLISVVQMPSRDKLNSIFSTAQDSVITERQEEHGGSGEAGKVLLCSTLLLHGVYVTDKSFCSAWVCFRVSTQQ